jgi:Carboxypeptidase regulatory-like domain
MYLLRAFLPLLVSSILVSSIPVKGQQPLVGRIQGTVVDQKQARIPYATLTATNIDSVEPESHRMTTSADEKGFYQFVDVPEGRYSIVVQIRGYRDYTIPEVTVRGGETVNMPPIKMSPAGRR